MDGKKFYITTPLYYVNAEPHIGHAYTTLAADIMARYFRSRNVPVFFQTGTDEHGSNIEKTAAAKGLDPQKFADEICAKFVEAWENLDITYDRFIRTTDPEHEKQVRDIFEHLIGTGDIYLGEYEGLYCSSCENFYDESELLEDNLCPVHKKPVERIKEESYFFRLSKYENKLLKLYESNSRFLSPGNRAKEIVNFVKSGLKDLSVSRTKVSWGIRVPSNENHTIYVWFDALLNYITGPGFRMLSGKDEKNEFGKIWPADIHLVGKEIYRFHAVIWPAMLMALDLPLPDRIFAHGWWTVNGEKMSKSKGNFINPAEVSSKYGLDAFRYFIFREVPFGGDGDFSFEMLEKRYNSDLANDLGNLFSRTMNLAVRNLNEFPSERGHDRIMRDIKAVEEELEKSMREAALTSYLDAVWGMISRLNRKIDEEKPWEKAKSKPDEAAKTLAEISLCLKHMSDWIYPFMPGTSEKMKLYISAFEKNAAEKKKPPILFPRLQCSEKR